MACGEETFSCVAFSDQGLVFLTELIPKFVEVLVVRAMNDMTEPIELY